MKEKVGLSGEFKASVGWGWNWAEKVQRSVGDISIKNTASRGNDQYHEIVYENLPKSDKRVGQIELVNDLGDKTYIKNIKVYSKDDPKQVVTFARSYPAKAKINLGCRFVTGKYIIEFDAQQAGSDKITHYKYSSHDYLPLDHNVPNVFYGKADFTAQ